MVPAARPVARLAVRESAGRTGGHGHFVILPFAARWAGGEVALNDELDDARWLTPGSLAGLPVTQGLEETIRAACALAGL